MFAIIIALVVHKQRRTRIRVLYDCSSQFALMQTSLYELKDKLVQSLDQENNVVNMAQVIEVISTLERTLITKDDLEKTRLGKYINELRKKTFNEGLARRAKELVKSWRKLLILPSESSNSIRIGSPLNGERVTPPGPGPGGGTSPGAHPTSPHGNSNSLAPQNGSNNSMVHLLGRKIQSSVSPASTSSSRLIASPIDCCSASNSPMLSQSHSSSYAPHSSRAYSKPDSPHGSAHAKYDISKINAANKRFRKYNDNDVINCSYNGGSESIQVRGLKRSDAGSVASLSPALSPALYDNCLTKSEEDTTSRKRGRKRKEVQVNDPLKEKVTAALRIHKLKTTQELAQEFNIEVQSNEAKDQTLNERIASSFSSKSHFPKIACDVDDETKTKTELMHRFLSSTSANEDDDTDKHDKYLNYTTNHYNRYLLDKSDIRSDSYEVNVDSEQPSRAVDSVGNEIRDILSQLPPLNISDIVWSDSEPDVSDSSGDPTEATTEVSEARVEKLNEDKWEYVNGTYDSETEWREWHEMTSAVTANGDVLHILPYVNIDY